MPMTITLPRFVVSKALAVAKGGDEVGFYWSVPAYWRKQGCPLKTAALGRDLVQTALDNAAAVWNSRFDEWRRGTARCR